MNRAARVLGTVLFAVGLSACQSSTDSHDEAAAQGPVRASTDGGPTSSEDPTSPTSGSDPHQYADSPDPSKPEDFRPLGVEFTNAKVRATVLEVKADLPVEAVPSTTRAAAAKVRQCALVDLAGIDAPDPKDWATVSGAWGTFDTQSLPSPRNGPQPLLRETDLRKGRCVEGWVLWAQPPSDPGQEWTGVQLQLPGGTAGPIWALK